MSHARARRSSATARAGAIAVALSLASLIGAGAVTAATPAAMRTVDARSGAARPAASFGIARVASGYDNLSFAGNARDGRLFVVEQQGIIRIVGERDPFLDIRGPVMYSGEQGLLGLAFHPSYGTNRRFFVYYTNTSGNNVVVEYKRSAGNPDVADAGSARLILTVSHPTHTNHNGGMIAFGPDGMLYIGTGDGGGAGDQANNAQDRKSLLGKLLRINVASTSTRYTIPSDNPYAASTTFRKEIWARGLRNPWRWGFNGWDLWIADVGQRNYEEVDRSVGSSSNRRVGGRDANYGWRQMEGNHCYVSGCTTSGMVRPVTEYTHVNGRCSITGGYVYKGHYFFADYCSGEIWTIPATRASFSTAMTRRADTGHNITSFGRGSDGRLYFVTAAGGVYRIDFTP